MGQNKDNTLEYLRDACNEMKQMVSKPGPDGTPGLLDAWTSEDYFNVLNDNLESFDEYIMTHPFFKDSHYSCLYEVYQQENFLFMYCLLTFLTEKLVNGCVGNITVTDPDDAVLTFDDKDTLLTTAVKDDEKENKKQLVNTVIQAMERKRSLKEFLNNLEDYKQYRNDIDECILHVFDFDKIHRTMELLDWRWCEWMDEDYETHTDSVPSAYGIRYQLISDIKGMEKWIDSHPDATEYYLSCGGIEIHMRMVEDLDSEDDYENQVRLTIRFILEDFDNAM